MCANFSPAGGAFQLSVMRLEIEFSAEIIAFSRLSARQESAKPAFI
jgi:hypothetical protein